MGLKGYILKRTIYNVIVLFAVITINFIIFRLMPGNPIDIIASSRIIRDPAVLEELYAKFGLDQPLYVQFVKYVKNLLTFEFGRSYLSMQSRPVAAEMLERIPNTILLLMSSTVVAVLIGVALGVVIAARRGKVIDLSTQAVGLFTYALPVFWLGMIFILIFYLRLDWFPGAGTISRELAEMPVWMRDLPFLLRDVLDRLWHLALPMTCLVLFSFGGWALLMRNTLTDIFTEDYILTARAKGLSERTVLYKHALRNAMLPLVTSLAINLGFILNGAVLTETVFSWYGMGRYAYEAILAGDYPVLQAFFYIVSLCVIAANFIADVLYGFLDPRVRY